MVRSAIFLLPALCVAALTASAAALGSALSPANPSALDRRWVHLQCDMSKDSGFALATNRIATAAAHGFTGVMFSLDSQLTSLYLWPEASRERLSRTVALCDSLKLEKGVVMWGPGYPKFSFFAIDPNLSAANPVFDTRYRVSGGRAVHLPPPSRKIVESPQTVHAPKRDGDFSRTTVSVAPKRLCRLAMTAKAEGSGKSWPVVLAVTRRGDGGNFIEHRVFWVKTDGSEQRFAIDFPSMNLEEVDVCCFAYNGAQDGHATITSLELSETAPVVAVRRHGTPITVRNAKTGETYAEGRDFAPVPKAKDVWPGDWIQPPYRFAIKPLPGGRIKEGDELSVDCYSPSPVWGKWQGACMGAVEMDEILEKSAAAVAKSVDPSVWLLGLDEVRTGGGCEDCRAIGDCAHIYAAFAKKCMAAVRRHSPRAQMYVWNDMVDPWCLSSTSRKGFYAGLYSGMKGVWDILPRDFGIAYWRDDSRDKGMPFFSKRGRRILVACYYDAKSLDGSVVWAKKALETPGADGIMYCTWCDKWELLGDWGDEMKRMAEEARR